VRLQPRFQYLRVAHPGGRAIYSSFLFWRKARLQPVVGNVLIAAGALSIGFASTLTRLGYGQFLYIGELVAAVLMFSGFMMAGKPQMQEVPAKQAIPAAEASHTM
jgi:hypothetical protein